MLHTTIVVIATLLASYEVRVVSGEAFYLVVEPTHG